MSTTYSSFTVIKRLFREHIAPYRRSLIIAILCMIVVAATTATNAWLIQPVLDQIFIAKDRTMLLIIPLAVFATSLAGAAANYGNTLNMRYVGTRVVADMQIRLFEHVMKSDVGMFQSEASGKLISRFTNDVNLLRNAFSNVLTAIAKESLSMLFLVGVMIYQNMELAAIAFVAFPIAIYPIIRLGKRMRRVSDSTQNQLGEFSATLDEVFKAVKIVKSYNRESYEANRAKNMIEKLFGLYYKSLRIQAAGAPIMEILSGLSIASVIWYGGLQVLDGETTPGAFFSFITAFLMAYKPVRSLSGLNTTLQEGISAAARLFTVLDSPPRIIDKPGTKALVVDKGHVHFDNVHFQYHTDSQGVFGVDLEVPAGKTVALVGLSGGGKSTLMSLLLRYYDANSGSISIDGQDIRNVTLKSLRDAMAFVPQESMLFDDTVRANIAYGRDNASDEDIILAAKNAAAHEFIELLPQGYDTMIGSHGMRLSGGQRQRIAIARAMLKNAPILLLDEATSSLDNESERAIQEALGQLMKDRTTLVIAHRLSTIVKADVIYVIAKGRVVESGTHQSLMSQQGKYYQLYAQSSLSE
ncbi:MAG: ABC transporter ATP-binding protein [Rickettsiales bacterium]|nr:ABC transporter ATP-binding protein [Rickettsiales bacterium]